MGVAVARVPRLRPRAWAIVLVLVVAALAGGWLWLRDCSLVRAEQVTVVGATGSEGAAITAALERTAQTMTTLHVDKRRLRRSVADYPQVKDVTVSTHPLHRLTVRVVQRLPVAALAVAGQRTAVAADGTLLRGRVSAQGLPTIAAPALPTGDALGAGLAAREVTVLAAAPAAMRRLVQSVREQDGVLVAQLRDGPRILLGDDERPRAKWVAAARVLSDSSSGGARYIDVRLPGRPAAGGFPDDDPASATDPAASVSVQQP
jgi:cell division protein FtsQ